MNREEQLMKDGITEGYAKAREEYRVQEWLRGILSNGNKLEQQFIDQLVTQRTKDYQKELKSIDTIEKRKILIEEEKLRYFGKNS